MKLFFFAVALAMAKGVLSNSCNADNCARAVTGTRPGKVPDVTSRMEDCSSFMKITVTPATSIITTTTTVTTTTTLVGMKKREGIALEERQVTVTPVTVPTYASACSGTARYSSACSCWGITAMTTTAPTPKTTTTVTVTSTVSVCPTEDAKCGTSCYNLKTDPNNCGSCGNKCASGICSLGTCTTPTCSAATCLTYTFKCSPNSNCFCAETSEGTGACAVPNNCGQPCTSTNDCGGDSVCAINTCCGAAGTCTLSVKACGPNVPPQRLAMREWVNGTQAHPAFESSAAV